MDVIENPFVRMKYFIDPVDLLRDMHAGGFRLYSSWPNYKDTLAMQWIKAPLGLEDEMLASISFVEQSRLSHLLGCKCFLPGITQEEIDNLALLIRVTDGLIDEWSQEACATAEACVDHIEDLLKKTRVATNEDNLLAASDVLTMTKSLFQLMGMDGVDRLVEFCRNDETFISTWGMPNHYAVFQRSEINL